MGSSSGFAGLRGLAEKLGGPVIAISGDSVSPVIPWLTKQGLVPTPGLLEHVRKLVTEAQTQNRLAGTTLGCGNSLIVAPLSTAGFEGLFATVLPTNLEMASKTVQLACEVLSLQNRASQQQVQLDRSARQIAQSTREQRWMRDLARNMSISSRTHSADHLAHGILAPLLGLIHAEDLYFIAHEPNCLTGNLSSAQFGKSTLKLGEIAQLVDQLGLTARSSPLVLNQANLMKGRIHSLIALPIGLNDLPWGILVAINRSSAWGTFGQPSPLAGFGALEMELLFEASTLLCTQAHNFNLMIESQHLILGSLHAMSRAIDARDSYTQGHSERVARLAFELGRILELSETACQEIYVAGILHDIGKIGIPDNVLLKNGALSEAEFEIIRKHPEIGHQIIEQVGKLQFTLPGVLYHHERWDGNGYPHKLRGESIPLMARILAVADSFDAMTSCRPYRDAMPIGQAIRVIDSGRNVQWDSAIVDCFEIWQAQRSQQLGPTFVEGASLIPQEPPYENITQAVFALNLLDSATLC